MHSLTAKLLPLNIIERSSNDPKHLEYVKKNKIYSIVLGYYQILSTFLSKQVMYALDQIHFWLLFIIHEFNKFKYFELILLYYERSKKFHKKYNFHFPNYLLKVFFCNHFSQRICLLFLGSILRLRQKLLDAWENK